MNRKEFLTQLQSEDAATRFAAWRRAGEMEAAVIPSLANLAISDKPGIRKAAREAITTLVHSVGKAAASRKRTDVVKRLQEQIRTGRPKDIRVLALRQLSLVGGDDTVPAVARLMEDPQLYEEAIYCIERIPGKAAESALAQALKAAPQGIQPRILAALGHRRVEAAATEIAARARSSNPDVALAAVKALGRIGKKPEAPAPAPAGWAETEWLDSLLRYADAQARAGNAAEAVTTYRHALDREEAHWQCAAIIGLARIRSEEAAALVRGKLHSAEPAVRITAEKALKSSA